MPHLWLFVCVAQTNANVHICKLSLHVCGCMFICTEEVFYVENLSLFDSKMYAVFVSHSVWHWSIGTATHFTQCMLYGRKLHVQ